MILGDMEMTALGTTTEVLGDRVLDSTPVQQRRPRRPSDGAGRISSIIPNLTTSFKLGALTLQKGKLTADQSVAWGV